ncbi:hypothetical protein SCLCIDRAFT_1220924, partial [Scleroderma citrinum Foug A]
MSPPQDKFIQNGSSPLGNDFKYRGELDGVKRQLGRQHIQMVSVAGCIGTGLFYGLGEILAETGPLGALLVYVHVLTVLYATIISVGEMTAFAPISGLLIHYAARWIDPAAGFALGWNYFLYTSTGVALEITAISSLATFWDHNSGHTAIYIGATIVGLFIINLFGVRWFGHSEIFFATLKIMLAVGLIIGGLVVSLGGGPNHDRIGFRYWKDPGPMVSTLEPGARGRFLGMLVAIPLAAYSVAGFEVTTMSSAEAVQPRTSVIRTMKFITFCLVTFYICSVIVVGMLVPSNYPDLSSQSPFVVAFQRAGIKVLPSIVNAIIITSAFSTANTYVFSSSRILYGLAVQNQAPAIFATCTESGVPWVAVITAGLFLLLAFMNVASDVVTVFNWFVSLTTVGGFIGWTTINITYLRYYYGLKIQDIVPRGIYRSPLQPYAAMWGIFWTVFYILVSGISVFYHFNASSFVSSYINLPIFSILYVGYKFWYKTKMQPLAKLDFVSNIPTLEETGDEGLLEEKATLGQKIGLS